MGITPFDNQSQIGVFYRYRSFNGYSGQTHKIFPDNSRFFNYLSKPVLVFDENLNKEISTSGHSHKRNPDDYEIYRVAEIRAKYFLHQRVEINAIMPYVMNSVRYNAITTHVQGQGDLNVFAGYHLLRKIEVKGLQQRLITGFGVKLKTGEFYLKDAANKRLHYLIQPGTGSNDYFIFVNYFASINKIGLSTNLMYKYNGSNYYKESVAPGFTNFTNAFYKIVLNENYSIIPAISFFYEFTQGEIYNGKLIGSHGMNNAMIGPSVDFFIKNISFNLAYQKSIFDLEYGHPESAGRVVFGINYNFRQSNYLAQKLFKKKIVEQ
ncbi:MAG: hypothetical protein ACK4IK_08895 [Bacteroidia bacterium]